MANPTERLSSHLSSRAGTGAIPALSVPVWTAQELLGHRHVDTTMIYTHILNRGGKGVQ